MLTSTPATWTVRGATFALWALAAACAVFWGLRLGDGGRGRDVPPAPPRAVLAADAGALATLLGSAPTAAGPLAVAPAGPTLASRLQLLGVAAGARSGGGAAVISVDGKPARPYRVGSAIEEGVVLQSVRGREATIAQADGTTFTLEVPLATLPGATSRPGAVPPVIAPPLPGAPPRPNR